MQHKQIFTEYFQDLASVAKQGDAREESFYPALANMLQAVAAATGREHVHITTLPKATAAGNPDFRLWNGKDRIIGYIEAKKPTEERLDLIEHSEQLRRYLDAFPNFILTNFCEFRLYRHGELIQKVLVARPAILTHIKTAPPVEQSAALYALLEQFLNFSLPKVFTAESLARELASRTKLLRTVIGQRLLLEKLDPGTLSEFFEAFQAFLIGTLTHDSFADLFAQTITYGLFAARTRAENDFNRRTAFAYIPRTIGVLRDLFRFISLGDVPETMAWCVDDIAEVLAVADAPGILDQYYREGRGSDPIVHFYETFLTQYDPAERERRGVYYTPEPIVGYIIRSVHSLLKSAFGQVDGLASPGVTLLDPAAGTMTFVARAAEQAVTEFESKYGSGGREKLIQDHILQNFYGFELMMAPYAVGHLKMGFFLEELGHRLTEQERVPFYLTNALDHEELAQSSLPGFSALAKESHLAGVIKKQTEVLVILGNPPYSGHSTNIGAWISNLIDTYKQVDGKPLGEKNPKWLQDDYVKFLRFAQWKIDEAGRGIVGMITNHSYLDNPTFRGMRQSLLRTFDEIYILDLHGNALKKETCPDGSADKNVFDIRQGVAIAFFVKRRATTTKKVKKTKQAAALTPVNAQVHHSELWGSRASKYAWLIGHDYRNTPWQILQPLEPFHLLVPHNDNLGAQYRSYLGVPEIFPLNSVGIVTARDKLTIHWSAAQAWQTIIAFATMKPEEARDGYDLGKDTRDWQVALAQKDIIDSGPNKRLLTPILYRPFDIRYTYYTGQSRGFICMSRRNVMGHMLVANNLALITVRQHKDEFGVWVTTSINAHKSVAAYDVNYCFPLYVYSSTDKRDPASIKDSTKRKPNINPELLEKLRPAYGQAPTPEEVFQYIYGILYTRTYRQKYAEFLRMDFPQIPFTADLAVFKQMAALGARLVALHLLDSPELDPPMCHFNGNGDNLVGRNKQSGLRYVPATAQVYINTTQYFAPVPVAVWEYQIGGYQVCEKWLKDRKDRCLELTDIRTYCHIVTALGHTIAIQQELELVYPKIEVNLLS